MGDGRNSRWIGRGRGKVIEFESTAISFDSKRTDDQIFIFIPKAFTEGRFRRMSVGINGYLYTSSAMTAASRY